MVTKNPCTHPGDIRLLKAVDESDERYEALSQFVNVVVFPSKGKRPEQHKMSGGDLDGDVYLAIWDQSIIDSLTPDMIKTPAIYKKFSDDGNLKSDKIEDHIKRYFEKDNLGHLSNLHLALCDQLGPNWDKDSEDTVELSRLIGVAVDFAKHGKCVDKVYYQ